MLSQQKVFTREPIELTFILLICLENFFLKKNIVHSSLLQKGKKNLLQEVLAKVKSQMNNAQSIPYKEKIQLNTQSGFFFAYHRVLVPLKVSVGDCWTPAVCTMICYLVAAGTRECLNTTGACIP